MSKRGKILVIDDEESICGFLRDLLEGEGYAVFTSGSADEALMFLSTQSFDLILTDINMPGLSGLELIKQVQEFGLNSLVIIMTSQATVNTAIEALRIGAVDFLQKPFEDLDYVASVVQRVLEQRQNQVEKQENLIEREVAKRMQSENASLPTAMGTGLQEFCSQIVSILSAKSVEAVQKEIVEQASILTGGCPGFLFLLNEETLELFPQASSIVGPKTLAKLRAKALGRKWQKAKGYLPLLEDILMDQGGPILFDGLLESESGTRSVLVICGGSDPSDPNIDKNLLDQFCKLATLVLDSKK